LPEATGGIKAVRHSDEDRNPATFKLFCLKQDSLD
jgi:hypothetical protein